MLLTYLHQILHLIFTILTIVVLEIEVLCHQCIQPQNIQQMVYVIPLRSVLLVQLLLLHSCYQRFAVCLDKRAKSIIGILSPFLVIIHLEFDYHMLLQQEMLEVFKCNTFTKTFPWTQTVLILPIFDSALQLRVILPCKHKHLSNNLSLSLLLLPTSYFIQHRQQKDDFVPLIQQKERIVLNILQLLIIIS